MSIQRTSYATSVSFLFRALLGYLAYVAIFPMWLPSYLNKLRGVKIRDPKKVYIAPNVLIDSIFPELVTIEEGVYLTRGVKILAHFNPTDAIAEILKKDSIRDPVLIKRGSFIGVNAIILPGVTIGECVIVGAGAVVTKSVPDYAIVGGNPAKVIGDVREVK